MAGNSGLGSVANGIKRGGNKNDRPIRGTIQRGTSEYDGDRRAGDWLTRDCRLRLAALVPEPAPGNGEHSHRHHWSATVAGCGADYGEVLSGALPVAASRESYSWVWN